MAERSSTNAVVTYKNCYYKVASSAIAAGKDLDV